MRKGGRTDIDAIRTEYVQGNASLKALAEKYGASRRTLESRSVREMWGRQRARYRAKGMMECGDGQLNVIRECAADALLSMKSALETATDVGDLYTIVRALKVTADIEFKTGGRMTAGEKARYDIELKRMEAKNMEKDGAKEICVKWADETLKEFGE